MDVAHKLAADKLTATDAPEAQARASQPGAMGPKEAQIEEPKRNVRKDSDTPRSNGFADVRMNAETSKHAESRIRVITLEAARLRKELQDCEAKRHRAVSKCKEYEEKSRWAERAVNELRFSNKQLQGELKLASEAAAASANRNRAALASLRAGLGAVEQAVAERAAKSHTQLQGLFSSLQGLQRIMLQRASVPAGDLLEVQRLFAEIGQGLGSVGSLIGGGLHAILPPKEMSEPPTPSPMAPVHQQRGHVAEGQAAHVAVAAELLVLKQRMTSLETERARLSAEADSLREELACERSSENVHAAALIPQYRMAVVKARAQASALRDRLAETAKERATLQDEVDSLRRALQERSRAQETEAMQSARALSEASAHRQQLEADLSVGRKRLRKLEEEATRWAAERESLLVKAGELELQCKQQQETVRQLRTVLSDQREDAQSILDMLSKHSKKPFIVPKTIIHAATAYEGNTRESEETYAFVNGVSSREEERGYPRVKETWGLDISRPSTTGGSSERSKRRNHYHRSRRRREDGYVSVPAENHVNRGKNELDNRLGINGDRSRANLDHLVLEETRQDLGAGNAGALDGQSRDRFDCKFDEVRTGLREFQKNDRDAGGVNIRLEPGKGRVARPSGGVNTGLPLDALLLTDSGSELIGSRWENAKGLSANQRLPAGQWPSHGLEETAAAFSLPQDNQGGSHRDHTKENRLLEETASLGNVPTFGVSRNPAGLQELQNGMSALDKDITKLQTSLYAASGMLNIQV